MLIRSVSQSSQFFFFLAWLGFHHRVVYRQTGQGRKKEEMLSLGSFQGNKQALLSSFVKSIIIIIIIL
jgi:hypothetical protein